MQRLARILILSLVCAVSAFGSDTIITRKGARIEGTLLKKTADKWAFRRTDGSLAVFQTDEISQYIRGNHIYDIEKKIHFLVEKQYPYLPFLVLTAGSGYYAVKKFQDYRIHRDEAAAEQDGAGLDDNYQNLNDQSNKDLAWGIASSLFCVGSLYIALKPVDVKTPLGVFEITAAPSRFNLALHF